MTPTRLLPVLLLPALALLPLPAPAQQAASAPAPAPAPAAGPGEATARIKASPKVYDEKADAWKDLAAAVTEAKASKKRVLVTFGANWCSWCRSLDALFHDDPKVKAALEKGYVPVKVDVGRMTKNLDVASGYGVDLKKTGLPCLVVVGADGKAVKVQETGALEEGKGHSPSKVIAFLEANAR